MNTSELEQRMREAMAEQEYAPPAAAWEQLKQELHPPAAASKAVFLFPAWKAAAAVALVLGTAFTIYFLQPRNGEQAPEIAGKPVAVPATTGNNIAAAPSKVQGTVLPKQETIPSGIPAPAALPATSKQEQHMAASPSVAAVPAAQQPAGRPEQPMETTAPAAPHKQQADRRSTAADINQLYPAYAMEPDRAREGKLNLGIAANIGKPSLGNFQYNVGVVARRQLGDRFFAEATVALASTQVNYSERIVSSDKSGGGLGSSDGGFTGIGKINSTDARYVNNILAVGVAPAFGVKATRDLSVSVGGDLYKSLNRTLDLQQDPGQLDKAGYSNVAADKNVSDWDAGVKAQDDYRVWQKLSLNMQYRQGLTRFILVDGKPITNSTFNIGMKYYIGR